MSDHDADDREPEPAAEDDREPEPAAEATNPAEATTAEIDSGTGVGDRPDEGHDPRDESTQIATEERRRKIPVFSAVIAVVGAWVVLSVLVVYDVSQAAFWNNVIVGAVVAVAAGYNYYRVSSDMPLSVGVSALLAVLGIWLIIAPALLEMPAGAGLGDSPFWGTLGAGFLIAALSGYNAYEAREARTVATEPEAGV
ncbi:SPW repeat domain-containing protein [Natrarchaeobaculum sulfurireducens]|uniref:SPW repeat-containing integral membrane domain-containing protein n=1 Tax=Natrarchaeobaculum sulfurireducens TaxID=2044521 RepID=A0A346PBI4_9EURY|nr:hypothetical protein [Natrarchaeobaculum sulfurireducens]AXR76879.1 hypothetical protein AArc1_0535 [Natrarchaeobaculum sulfurireducens]AXR80545.1 hypothetical protein AArcMg_0522 [Natrarchaeobaculum sulfurireducens]